MRPFQAAERVSQYQWCESRLLMQLKSGKASPEQGLGLRHGLTVQRQPRFADLPGRAKAKDVVGELREEPCRQCLFWRLCPPGGGLYARAVCAVCYWKVVGKR